jgi:DNA-binding CsgD family transcriptional regulator
LLGGCAIALLKISYGEMFSRVRLDEGLILLGLALVVSAFLAALALALHPVLVQLMFVACGFGCVPMLRFGTRDKSYMAGFVKQAARQTLKPSWTFLALPVLVAFAFGSAHSAAPAGTGWLTGLEQFVPQISGFIAGSLLIIVSLSFEDRLRPAQIYAWALVLVVLGFVLLSVGLIAPAVGNIILLSGFLLFYLFMIVFWGSLAKRMGRSVVLAYLVGYTAFQAAQLAGNLLSWLLLAGLSLNGTITFALCVILLFFAAVLLVYGSVSSPFRVWLMADSVPENSDEISDACALISRRYHLTPREHEVLSMLARGRNASHIAQTHNISHETAKTHIKNIHRKLNLHTQAEIFTLLDKTVQEGS